MSKKEFITNTPLSDKASERLESVSEKSLGGNLIDVEIPKSADVTTNANGDDISVGKIQGKKSLFNNFYIFKNPTNIYTDADFSRERWMLNPSIEDLINKGQGANKYDVEDFLYLDKFGILPNNRLITLRRFEFPVMDDITTNIQTEPDISRLLTYFDQSQNPVGSWFNMSFGMKWKELTASIDETSTSGDSSGASGFQKSILKLTDPGFGNSALRGDPANNMNPYHDQNKTYGAVDSIDSTHIRDRGLKFDQPISLQFKWEMKSIDGIDPKAAMLDLISNIIRMCTNDGKFFGGLRYYTGSYRSSQGKDIRKLANAEYIKFMNRGSQDLKSYVADMAGKIFSAENISNVANNLLNLSLGKVLDKLGRPSVHFSNSLLSNEPTGLYHLQIGNPFNPILSMGNMIIENSTLSIPDDTPLGNGDFPTMLQLQIDLKHSMPRDAAGIEKMFTAGKGRTYWKPNQTELNEMLKGASKPKSLEGFLHSSVDDTIRNLYPFQRNRV